MSETITRRPTITLAGRPASGATAADLAQSARIHDADEYVECPEPVMRSWPPATKSQPAPYTQAIVDPMGRDRTAFENCLDLWLRWLCRSDVSVGWRGRSACLTSEAAASSEQLYDRMDNEAGAAVDAMVDSLKPHLAAAIRKRCGMAKVWRFPLQVFADTLEEAEMSLLEKLKKNIATRNYFP